MGRCERREPGLWVKRLLGRVDRLEAGRAADRLEAGRADDRLDAGRTPDRLDAGRTSERLEAGLAVTPRDEPLTVGALEEGLIDALEAGRVDTCDTERTGTLVEADKPGSPEGRCPFLARDGPLDADGCMSLRLLRC